MKREIYITTKEISAELHKSLRTIQAWIKLGKLPAEKLGGTYLIRENDYQEFKSRFIQKAS